MKRKNLKSVIHNFAHSFQAFDFRISQFTVLQELCTLYKRSLISSFEVDFIKKTISPKNAQTKVLKQIVNDYLDWLPELCLSQNVDQSIIKKLKIKIEIDFQNAKAYKSSRNERVLKVLTTYCCLDDLNNELLDTFTEFEVAKKQAFENC